jgi:hypothetical protein
MFFSNENRARIKEENPDATFGGLGKLLGEEWRGLTSAEKKPYDKMNAEDKKRYTKELAAYKLADVSVTRIL